MHHGISRRKDMKLINSIAGISLHLVLRNYMEMMFIIVDTSRCSWQLPAPPQLSFLYILHTASRRPVTGCSNCFASSESRWIAWPRSREALNKKLLRVSISFNSETYTETENKKQKPTTTWHKCAMYKMRKDLLPLSFLILFFLTLLNMTSIKEWYKTKFI